MVGRSKKSPMVGVKNQGQYKNLIFMDRIGKKMPEYCKVGNNKRLAAASYISLRGLLCNISLALRSEGVVAW